MNNETANVFITGNSSGLGLGLTEACLERGWQVYGCSRRGCGIDAVQEVNCDLTDFTTIEPMLKSLLDDVPDLELVVLNAGVLAHINYMTSTSLEEMRNVMDINVWANKVILDWLYKWGKPVKQIVVMSSGAAVLGNKGWGAYALSKATLNMLTRLYSHEFPHTHICALAPGLIDTGMMDYLCNKPDREAFPALQRICDARGTDAMPQPREAAERILKVLPDLREYESGSFIDIRQILAPEEYEQLMQARNLSPSAN